MSAAVDRTRRGTFLARRIGVGAALSGILAGALYLPITLLAPVPSVTPVTQLIAAPAPTTPVVDLPEFGASGVGAVGYDGVLVAAGESTPLPIASISKIVTALVVLEARPLRLDESGPTITFTQQDVDFYIDMVAQDGIVAPARVGQQVTQRTLLDVALMASANNYAESLAAWAFGSEEAYAQAATTWLAAHGLADTTIVDATGISPSNTSTIADLVALGTLALANPVVATIVGTQTLDVPGIGTVSNRNLLLGIDGVTGIKTGTLDESGACLLFSQDITVDGEPITLVGAVLGGPDHPTVAAIVQALLVQADAGFARIPLVRAGTPLARYDTAWGQSVTAVASADASVVVWRATPITADLEIDPVQLAQTGADVGDLTFTANGRSVSVDADLTGAITDPGPWWRLTHPTALF